jgi:predicted lipid-binding transport protein (Tim44 family)
MMSNSFAYIDIILFAMLAAFIAFRLRSVLGRKTGSERRRAPASAPREAAPPVPVPVEQPDQDLALDDADGLARLRAVDPSFDPQAFLQGARTAFGMVLDAFAKGERTSLEPLVERDVYESFVQAIEAREVAGEAHGATLLSIEDAQIVAIHLDGSIARVTVRFTSHQSDPAASDPVHAPAAEPVVDVWTFARDTRSPDPNWRLAETRAPQT